jgi:hypothetical protein
VARKGGVSALYHRGGRRDTNVSEVELMSPTYPLNVHRRIERQWAERIKSLRQVRGQIVVVTGLTLKRLSDRSLSARIVDRRPLHSRD